jgi:NarL family two-component system response regulator LiaR
MTRPLLIYGVLLGVGAFALTWVNYQHTVRVFSTQIYIVLIALAFTALGIWVGRKLSPRRTATNFAKNDIAQRQIGMSAREYEVLEKVASGLTNKQIARDLGISPHTVKTQVSSLLTKLNAARRTEAIKKARRLNLIP